MTKGLTLFLVIFGIIFIGSPLCLAKQRQVFVSIPPQVEFVKAIGKEKVKCHVLVPHGSSPELAEIQPVHLKSLNQADIYFMLGTLPFEKVAFKKIRHLNPNLTIVNPPLFKKGKEVDHHIWLSIKWVKQHIDLICRELIKLEPTHKVFFEQNRKSYIDQLDRLDQFLSHQLSGLKHRTFMVNHPAFTYFSLAYGLKQLAIEEEGKEPTFKDLKQLIDQAKKDDVNVIFIQPQDNPSLAKSLAKQLEAEIVLLDPLLPGYLDNMYEIGRLFHHYLK